MNVAKSTSYLPSEKTECRRHASDAPRTVDASSLSTSRMQSIARSRAGGGHAAAVRAVVAITVATCHVRGTV